MDNGLNCVYDEISITSLPYWHWFRLNNVLTCYFLEPQIWGFYVRASIQFHPGQTNRIVQMSENSRSRRSICTILWCVICYKICQNVSLCPLNNIVTNFVSHLGESLSNVWLRHLPEEESLQVIYIQRWWYKKQIIRDHRPQPSASDRRVISK